MYQISLRFFALSLGCFFHTVTEEYRKCHANTSLHLHVTLRHARTSLQVKMGHYFRMEETDFFFLQIINYC